MSLSAVATALNARIRNFKENADHEGLGHAAQALVTKLSERTGELRQVGELMECLRVENSVDADDVRRAIGDFQQQLEQVGLRAVQRPAASKLSGSVGDLHEKADRRGKSVWRNLFSGLTEDIATRVQRLGWSALDRKAKGAYTKVNATRLNYPVADWEKTKKVLGGDCSKWPEKIDALIVNLTVELDVAETAVAARPEAVQEFIAKASNNGFALKNLTPELLAQLRDEGIVDDYTVKKLE